MLRIQVVAVLGTEIIITVHALNHKRKQIRSGSEPSRRRKTGRRGFLLR